MFPPHVHLVSRTERVPAAPLGVTQLETAAPLGAGPQGAVVARQFLKASGFFVVERVVRVVPLAAVFASFAGERRDVRAGVDYDGLTLGYWCADPEVDVVGSVSLVQGYEFGGVGVGGGVPG